MQDCIILHFHGSLSAESHGQNSSISVGGGLSIYGGSFINWQDLFTAGYAERLWAMADTVSIGLLTGQIIGVWEMHLTERPLVSTQTVCLQCRFHWNRTQQRSDQTDEGQSGDGT